MKTLAAVITAFMVSALLLVVSAPANAAYPKSVSTSCNAAGSPTNIRKTSTPRVAFAAKPRAGSATVKGSVRFSFVKNGRTVRTVTRSYYGGSHRYSFNRLPRGTFYIKSRLSTPANSVFKGCGDYAMLRVRR